MPPSAATSEQQVLDLVVTLGTDLGVEGELSVASMMITLVVGIVVVTLAPLFAFRRMRRMDVLEQDDTP